MPHEQGSTAPKPGSVKSASLARTIHSYLRSFRKVAVLSRVPAPATQALHFVAGSERDPDARLPGKGLQYSPIVNAGGIPAASFVPQITVRDNINFFARLHGVDAAALARLVDAGLQLGSRLSEPVRELDAPLKRAVEASVIAALPYDCYLIDRFEMLHADLRDLLICAARRRGSGLVFATIDSALAQQSANACLVLNGGGVQRLNLGGSIRPKA